MFQRPLVVAVAILMFAEMTALAVADPFEDGLDAFNAADYAQAYAIWWRLAKDGDAKAEASLGFMYYSGKGVRRDDEQSLYWFRRAADAGIQTKISCHTFRATGITEYLRNGGKLEVAQQMANHESARTTGLYDRRNDQVSLDEVERILI